MSNFKTAVIGAGPIGAILAAFLRKQNEDVILVDTNREHLDAIRKNGVIISGLVELNTPVDKYCYAVDELAQYNPDVIALCVKTPVMEKITPALKTVFKPDTKLISFQNGLYNEDYLSEHFGEKNVLRSVVNYAGNYIEPGIIKMTFFNKPNYIGASSSANMEFAEKYAGILTDADLETVWCDNIRKEEWVKVILNAALSPISAITGLTMKEIMDNPDIRQLVEASLQEGIDVATAAGFELRPDFFEFGIGYLSKAGYHKPSMRIDIENLADTEMTFLNQKIVEYGAKHGVPTPTNTALCYLVKGMEIENNKRKQP